MIYCIVSTALYSWCLINRDGSMDVIILSMYINIYGSTHMNGWYFTQVVND